LNRDKLRLFAIRDDRTGLGRVFDSRYPQAGCRGEVKFPLGRWKQGEVREYQLDCARGKRPLKVKIEEIGFVYDGVPHSCASTGCSWKDAAEAPICATYTARCAGWSTCRVTSREVSAITKSAATDYSRYRGDAHPCRQGGRHA
jgi:hypothetical protein